jgi:hypothetical protein
MGKADVHLYFTVHEYWMEEIYIGKTELSTPSIPVLRA